MNNASKPTYCQKAHRITSQSLLLCKGSITETARDQTLLRHTPESTSLDNMEGTSEATTLDNMEGTPESTTLDDVNMSHKIVTSQASSKGSKRKQG